MRTIYVLGFQIARFLRKYVLAQLLYEITLLDLLTMHIKSLTFQSSL
jgi:hypothetical protein